MQFDWSAIWPAIPILFEGVKMTLWISVLGLAGGLIIGLAAGFARSFGGWIANHIALVFIEIIRRVILPLALRRMLPPLGNQWIISIKDTSLFIVIGVAELTRQGQEIIAGNFRALEIWSAVAVFYLIITLVLSFILRRLERRMKIL